MAQRDVVVVGASAGGVEALQTLVAGLPPDLPASVLAVLHLPPGCSSALVRILDRSGPLPAEPATDGRHLERGRVYVAPPDHHLLIRDGHLSLSSGPPECGHRPAIDPLFRSAALTHGSRTVGVVLSGTLDDGASGLAAIARHGGAAVVQDPRDARYAGMPMAALATVPDAVIAPVAELAGVVTGLVRDGPIRTAPNATCMTSTDTSAEALTSRPTQRLETALWMALRTLQDKAALHRRMAEAAERRGAEQLAAWSWRSAQEAADSASLIRERLDRLAQDRPAVCTNGPAGRAYDCLVRPSGDGAAEGRS